MKLLSVLLVGILAACTPTSGYLPPDEPLVFEAPYDGFFEATLQAAATSYAAGPGVRYTFAIADADRDTGLITAVRYEREQPTLLGTRRFRDGGLSFNLGFSVPGSVRERDIVTIVVRPLGDERTALAYSTTDTGGTTSRVANLFMLEVLEKLSARFELLGVERVAD